MIAVARDATDRQTEYARSIVEGGSGEALQSAPDAVLRSLRPAESAHVVRGTLTSALQTGANRADVSELSIISAADDESASEQRRKRGWGSRFLPPVEGSEEYALFRQLCDDLVSEVDAINDFLVDGEVTEEGLGAVVEIEHLLDRLYDCNWGKDEILQRAVVAVQSQVNNAQWTTRHVEFLRDVLRFLRPRYVLGEDTIDECYEIIEKHGLDPFRGTVSEPEVLKRYRIVEVQKE